MERLVHLCQRAGYIFSGSSIYGGFANTYDYGPLGLLIKTTPAMRCWEVSPMCLAISFTSKYRSDA